MSRTAMSSQQAALRDAYGDIGYEQAQDVHQVITGTPDTVIGKLQKVIDVVDPAWLVLWAERDRCRMPQRCVGWSSWARR